MIGRTLSHYRIEDRLGTGGMGSVYRAQDLRLGRPVALKFPHAGLLADRDSRERFLREARTASALDHPNIVVLYDVCEADGEIFLAMQCVEGTSLRERLRSGPIPVADAVAIARCVADALAHAHGRGVVHRDVKPENILLGADGRTQVADFGTALHAGETRLSGAGSIVGTLGYLAPEVLAGGTAEPRSDLYSLGVVMHELFSGAAPFAGEPAAVLHRALHEAPPPLPERVPEPIRRLVGELLEKKPERRPRDAVEVADTLAHVARGEPTTPIEAGGERPNARSLAILYFENLSGDAENDYFCAGITEDLLTDVLQIPDLQVASRTMTAPFRNQAIDARRIGRELGVATVLEGGVRRAGGRVRVNARLVRTNTGYQLWAERYDRSLEDLFEVQDDISHQIANALRLAFAPADTGLKLARRTKSARAYDLRLQALDLYRRFAHGDMGHAIELLEEALRADPDYGVARAELAECCVQMICKGWSVEAQWLERAEREATRALEAAPDLPEGHRALGHLWNHRRRPDLALQAMQRAVELDPRYADALLKLGSTSMFLGDLSRAEIYFRRALELDPRDARSEGALSDILLRLGRVEECRAAARRALDRNLPEGALGNVLETLLLSYLRARDLAGAANVAAEIRERLGADHAVGHALLALEAAHRDRAEAVGLLAAHREQALTVTRALVVRARVHAVLGEREHGIAALERARQLELVDLDEVRHDPELAPLRDDPRFERLLALA